MLTFTKRPGIIVFLAITGLLCASCDFMSNYTNMLSGTVFITGEAQVGQTLTADISALGGSGVITFQWVRGGIIAIGSNSVTYIVHADDAGSRITVTVSRAGSVGSITSAPTAKVPDLDAALGTSEVTLTAEQIIDGAPVFGNITISRTGTGFPVTYNVSAEASGFDQGSIRWEVDGVGHFMDQTVIGFGSSFTLDAADIRYNSLGGHTLNLTVSKNGMQYKRSIPFTITQ